MGKREDERSVDRQRRRKRRRPPYDGDFRPEALPDAPPVGEADRPGAGRLHIQDSVAGLRQPEHDLLRGLPREIPFAARQAHDVTVLQHRYYASQKISRFLSVTG